MVLTTSSVGIKVVSFADFEDKGKLFKKTNMGTNLLC